MADWLASASWLAGWLAAWLWCHGWLTGSGAVCRIWRVMADWLPHHGWPAGWLERHVCIGASEVDSDSRHN
jgi:hypothetical protein